jgi:ketosteroid isomerase-like protein
VSAAAESENAALVRQYYAAMARGPAPLEWERWFAPDVVQEEFPNRLLPEGARRDLAGLREAAAKGQALLSEQRFDLLELTAQGNRVVVEAEWHGTVARDLGPFNAGMVLRTRFAQVFEFRGGKIAALRNYDCFYPW